jgi:hypothetical protein
VKNIWKYLPAFALAVYLLTFFSQPINLVVTDLGRHITNGANILEGNWDVLYTNFYSYTEANHPFINHHWGTGVIFHLVESAIGFTGLHAFYLLLILASTMLLVFSLEKENRAIGFSMAILMVPLIAYRTEVRPEGFSYLLMAANLLLLSRYQRGEINFKPLAISLLVIQLGWVNLHIFWPIGIGMMALFAFQSLLNGSKEEGKKLLMVLLGAVLVSLINPFGFKGLLAPFNIFTEYGYMVAENQSWWFMFDRFGDSDLLYFLIAGIISIAGIVYLIIKGQLKNQLVPILLAVGSFVLGLLVVRGIVLFALLSIPLYVSVIAEFHSRRAKGQGGFISNLVVVFGCLFVLIGFFTRNTVISPVKYYQVEEKGKAKFIAANAIGLTEGIHRSTEFFKDAKIPGPLFNNYDAGSFLIHGLKGQKVFTDNRPEAYSVAHFKEVYQPIQEDDNAWRAIVAKYDINSIFFYRHDNTPWGQDFLIRRVQDPEWIPIYVDQLTIILLRDVPANQPWIDQYRLPDSMFGVKPN